MSLSTPGGRFRTEDSRLLDLEVLDLRLALRFHTS
jgi:hypothetical protein